MTPAARTHAAIELLDAIVSAAEQGGAAADTLIARYFKDRRYAGSKDRRAVRELVYAAIRMLGERPAHGRSAMLALAAADSAVAATFDGSPYGPAAIGPDETPAAPGVMPRWLAEHLDASGIDSAGQAALLDRAPLDLRINTLTADADAIRAALPDATPFPGVPDALRLPSGSDAGIAALGAAVEVQDIGSQIVTLAAAARADMKVVDLCAGAGGKTLALAAAMGNRGAILATDTDRARLQRLPPRAARAGVSIVATRLLDPSRESEALDDVRAAADIVLIDAPCSGTGTWRRNPEARWRLTPMRVDRLIEAQRRLLAIGAPLVRPGGALVYIVCSLLDGEGAAQVDAFLAEHAGWRADTLALPAGTPRGAGVRLTPAHDATDGFFVARLRAPC